MDESDGDDVGTSSSSSSSSDSTTHRRRRRPRSMSRFPPPPRRKKLSQRNSLSLSNERKSSESEKKHGDVQTASHENVAQVVSSVTSESIVSIPAMHHDAAGGSIVPAPVDASACETVVSASRTPTSSSSLPLPVPNSVVSDSCSVISDMSELSVGSDDARVVPDSLNLDGASARVPSSSSSPASGSELTQSDKVVSSARTFRPPVSSHETGSITSLSDTGLSEKSPFPTSKKHLAKKAESTQRATKMKSKPKEDGREASIQIIELDIGRTFPDLQFFHPPDGPLYEPLLEILASHAVHRPDIGYVQVRLTCACRV